MAASRHGFGVFATFFARRWDGPVTSGGGRGLGSARLSALPRSRRPGNAGYLVAGSSNASPPHYLR
jgi:hypothetical protein